MYFFSSEKINMYIYVNRYVFFSSGKINICIYVMISLAFMQKIRIAWVGWKKPSVLIVSIAGI